MMCSRRGLDDLSEAGTLKRAVDSNFLNLFDYSSFFSPSIFSLHLSGLFKTSRLEKSGMFHFLNLFFVLTFTYSVYLVFIYIFFFLPNAKKYF